jgi:DNA-binding NarL/FixJ family response regulator
MHEQYPSPLLKSALQRRVVELVAQGFPNREIAEELEISEHIVGRVIRGISRQLGVCDRLELILYAIVHGMSGSSHEGVPPDQTREAQQVAAG